MTLGPPARVSDQQRAEVEIVREDDVTWSRAHAITCRPQKNPRGPDLLVHLHSSGWVPLIA
jgi:hypothetical protein